MKNIAFIKSTYYICEFPCHMPLTDAGNCRLAFLEENLELKKKHIKQKQKQKLIIGSSVDV